MSTVQTLPPQKFPLTLTLDTLPSHKESQQKLGSLDKNSHTPPSFEPVDTGLGTPLVTTPIKAISWKAPSHPFFLQNQKVTMARLDVSNLTEVLDRNKRRSPPTTLDQSIHGLILGLPYGKLELWDIHTGTHTSTFELEESSIVNSTATLGHKILCGSNHLSLFDVRQEAAVWTKLSHDENPVPTVSFVSPHLMMSGHQDHFSIWDIRSLHKPLTQPQIGTSSHHWCGSQMISTGNDVVYIWKMTNTHLSLSCSLPLQGCSKVYMGPNKAAAIALDKLYTCTSKELKVTKTYHKNPPSAIGPERNCILTQTESGHIRLFPL